MKRSALLLASVAAMALVAAISFQGQEAPVTQIAWAAKGTPAPNHVAVLLEFGVKDVNVRDWSGKVTIKGAAHHSTGGYRLRSDDKVSGPKSWQLSSHRPLRAPK